jgi:hypothetical protein
VFIFAAPERPSPRREGRDTLAETRAPKQRVRIATPAADPLKGFHRPWHADPAFGSVTQRGYVTVCNTPEDSPFDAPKIAIGSWSCLVMMASSIAVAIRLKFSL